MQDAQNLCTGSGPVEAIPQDMRTGSLLLISVKDLKKYKIPVGSLLIFFQTGSPSQSGKSQDSLNLRFLLYILNVYFHILPVSCICILTIAYYYLRHGSSKLPKAATVNMECFKNVYRHSSPLILQKIPRLCRNGYGIYGMVGIRISSIGGHGADVSP